MQVGGGINVGNACSYLEEGASHVIVTSVGYFLNNINWNPYFIFISSVFLFIVLLPIQIWVLGSCQSLSFIVLLLSSHILCVEAIKNLMSIWISFWGTLLMLSLSLA